MDDLISRQAALAEIDKSRDALLSSGMTGAEHILVHYGRRVIEEVPPIEPKRGRWVNDRGLYKCSVCDNLLTGFWAVVVPEERMYKEMKYCPNCGATMERSEDGGEER